MQEVTRERLVVALKKIGLKQGDGVLVHSALQYLGMPRDGVATYLHALASVLNIDLTDQSITQSEVKHGKKTATGTLVVPAFNFDFAHGEPYDPQTTPSQNMGVFSEYVRQQPGALRTSHPMQSLAMMGAYASDLASRDTLSAFDPESAFERMLELDFKILLLGCDIQAISLYHYCEQRANVPYRYWKDFQGQVHFQDGWQTRTYRMFVRDLQIDARIDIHPLQAVLESRKQWLSVPLNYGKISLCRMVDFVTAADVFLAADPWSLVTNRPV
jgi:aminoglycoside N3'-acetyltransferase